MRWYNMVVVDAKFVYSPRLSWLHPNLGSVLKIKFLGLNSELHGGWQHLRSEKFYKQF